MLYIKRTEIVGRDNPNTIPLNCTLRSGRFTPAGFTG